MDVLSTKVCSKCGETHPVTAFTRKKATKDGIDGWCKKCNSASAKRWRENNQLATTKIQENWRKNNRVEINAYVKEYYKNNIEKIRRLKREIAAIGRVELHRSYVIARLVYGTGFRASEMPESLIEAKREQLILLRLTRQLMQEVTHQQENGNVN